MVRIVFDELVSKPWLWHFFWLTQFVVCIRWEPSALRALLIEFYRPAGCEYHRGPIVLVTSTVQIALMEYKRCAIS